MLIKGQLENNNNLLVLHFVLKVTLQMLLPVYRNVNDSSCHKIRLDAVWERILPNWPGFVKKREICTFRFARFCSLALRKGELAHLIKFPVWSAWESWHLVILSADGRHFPITVVLDEYQSLKKLNPYIHNLSSFGLQFPEYFARAMDAFHLLL